MDDPQFPQITYRRGASGMPTPVLRGTGIRVQAIAIAHEQWEMAPAEIAEQYGLSLRQIEESLAFFADHRAEIEGDIKTESELAGTLREPDQTAP